MSDLTSLFKQLEVYSQSDSHKKVRDTALAILTRDKTNVSALKKCLIASINLDNYPFALNLILDNKDLVEGQSEELKLELAYVYYKLNKGEELLNLIQSVKSNEGLNHILAQYYYRNGEELKALEIYRDLINSGDENDEELDDVYVNERAVISQLRSRGIKEENRVRNSTGSSYDELFNDALIDAIEGDYETALNKLAKALQLIEGSNLSSTEQAMEISPINVQIGYIQYLRGDYDASLQTLNQLGDLNDDLLNLIVLNNKLAMIPNIQDFDATLLYRELGFPNSLNVGSKLTYPQERDLKRNELLLAFHAGKDIHSKSYNIRFPYSGVPNAIELIKGYSMDNVKSLGKLAIQKNNPSLSLLVCQRAFNGGNPLYASMILESLILNNKQVLQLPALGKLIITLYESMDQKKKLELILSDIYQVLYDCNKEELNQRYCIFIALKLMSVNEEHAHLLLQKIGRADVLNVESIESVSDLTQGVDVGVLLEKGITPLIKEHTKVIKPKHKRKRVGRKLPKRMDGTIDSERWLPLKDRSSYKPKKGKRDTQG